MGMVEVGGYANLLPTGPVLHDSFMSVTLAHSEGMDLDSASGTVV